ncbi:YcjX family protein [Ferrimonas lipolytica]|uniref:YcjX family protein n=1 Tax=Ferrimonas lipolytica TaxID=2724191 RepID=A0A6H1UB14_9GAMM|nr:YcjX family protein [Ferrimonas lipolytica]QIZ75829.1 YcjX family protein [Ferrimonas lipolytica]
MVSLTPHLKRFGKQLEQIAYRGLDQHLRIGITGLSRAGKTALITSIVHQLTHANRQQLPMWQALAQGRVLGVQRVPQPDLTMLPFDYDGAMTALTSNPPQWPESTRGLAEIRLAIRFAPQGGIKRQLADHLTLYLDLVDYPGEWLLDLPLLELDYGSWCQQQWQWLEQQPWLEVSQRWLQLSQQQSGADETQVAEVAQHYSKLLQQLRLEQGATFLQPGRALLPGDLEGTPILAFYPQQPQQVDQNSALTQMLTQRFEAYKEQVVKPFYRNHFSKFDRQLVLIDSLAALNHGRAQVEQMSQSLQGVLQSFHYGPGSLLRRMLSPRIDKLLFVAGKADHISIDQHTNLLALTDSLMGASGKRIRFSGAQSESMVLSAIRASEPGQVDDGSGPVAVIRGFDQQQNRVMRFPGEVPRQLPPEHFWRQQGFDFTPLAPPRELTVDGPMPHMRMDHLIDWMLGDKLS